MHYISINYHENFVLDTFKKVFYIIIGIQLAIIHKIIAYKHGHPFLRQLPTEYQQALSECQQLTNSTLLAAPIILSRDISALFLFM